MKRGMKPSLKPWKMFPVSSPALNTIGRALCWISHFGPDGHEMKVIISLIRALCVSPIFMDRAELFPPWAFVGPRLWGPLERMLR